MLLSNAANLILLDAKVGDGRWITIEGEHVYIKDGKIAAGPKDLVGKDPGKLPPRKESEDKKPTAEPKTEVKKKSPVRQATKNPLPQTQDRPYKYPGDAIHKIDNSSDAPVHMLDPGSLTSFQPHLQSDVSAGIQGDIRRPIIVVRHNGKNYIEEGNHRAAHAMMEGKNVPAKIIDLDSPKLSRKLPKGDPVPFSRSVLLSNAAKLILLDNPNHDERGRFAESESGGGRAAVRSQRAKVGDLHPATKVGTGKDSKIVMADGSDAHLSNSATNHPATGASILLSQAKKMRRLTPKMPAKATPILQSRCSDTILLAMPLQIDCGGGDSASVSHGIWSSTDTDLAALLNHRATQTGLSSDADLLRDAAKYLGLDDGDGTMLSRAANSLYLWRADQTRDEKGRFSAGGGTPVNTAHPRLKEATKAIRRLEYARRQKVSTTPEHAELTKKLNDLRGQRRGEWRKVLEEEKAAVAAKMEKFKADQAAERAKLYQQHGETAASGASNRLNPIGQHVSRLNEKLATLTGEPATAYLKDQPQKPSDPFDAFNAAVEEHYAAVSNPTMPNAPPLQSEAARSMPLDPTKPNDPVRVDPSRQFGLFAKDD